MSDIAALSLSVNSDQVKQATVALREMGPAASAAERAAQRWGVATDAAGRTADDFSKRVKRTIADLEFQRQQLARTSSEQERYAILKRAGVSASSAEGIAISASVRALQAQKEALGQNATVLEKVSSGWASVRGVLLTLGLAGVAASLIQMANDSLNAAAGLDELAEQLGITTKGLQSLQFSAVQNGVKLEQLETGISKFSQKIGEAAGGSKEMIEALDRLGVKILDARGKLLPTEAVMQSVAKAILAIDDPAKRAAAAVDFFGKAGTRMLPLLPDIARGFAEMGAAAQKAGAIISAEAIAKLDKLADSGERSRLVLRALFAENAAGPLAEILDFINRKVENLSRVINAAKGDLLTLLGMASNPGAALASILGPNSRDKLASELAARQSEVADMQANLAIAQSERDKNRIQAALDKANADLARAQRRADVANVSGRASALPGDPDNVGVSVAPKVPKGVNNPAITGAGKAAEDAQKKYDKLTIQLQETARAQDIMTAAAARGDVAFEGTKVHLDAVQKTLEIFGKRLADNDPLLVELEARLLRIARGKVAEAFSVATTELEHQNEVLAKQIELMGQPPELIAKEIALIKIRQDLEKAGGIITQDEIDRRYKAVNATELLTAKQAELQRAQELWTEPLKTALSSIQTTAADAFANILETGKFNFQALGDAFKKIIIRMAAEFLALATIRPVMSVLVNAISPGMAQSLGVGSATGGGMFPSSAGSSGGGGGIFGNLFGGGSISDFFGQTILGGGANFGPVQPGVSFASLGTSGGLTLGGALGGIAGIGMGAYSLLSGGGSTGSMIGGGAGILGGLTSIIGPLVGLGAMAGPIGMGISILGSILGGVLGGSSTPPKITNQEYGQLSYGSGGWGTSGGAWGPTANANNVTGALGQIGSTMDTVFKAFGGVKDAGKVWGLALESFSQKQGDQSFANQTSFLVGPGGQKTQWGMGSTEGDVGLTSAAVQATVKSILEGAVGDISDNMRKALATVNESGKDTFETLSSVVTEIKNFDTIMDGLGKTVTSAETSLKAIDDQFQSLTDTAEKYGIDTAKIDSEQAKARTKVATDFADSLRRALDDRVDESKGALADLEKEHQAAIDTNKYIVDNVTGALDQINAIEELYGKKRADIVEAANAAMVQKATDAWQTVPALARSQYLFTQRQGLTEQLQAINDDTAAIGANPMATQIKGLARERDQFQKGVGDVFGTNSTEYLDASVAAYLHFEAQMRAANDNFRDGLEQMTRELEGAGVANIKNLMDARAKDIATATALDGPYFDGILMVGDNVVAATKAWNEKILAVADDFAYSISQGLLAFSDPLQVAINDNNRARDEALATAKANNDAVGAIYKEQADRIRALDAIRVNDLGNVKYTNELAANEKRALTEIEALNVKKWTEEAALAKTTADQVGASLAAMGSHYVSMADVTELYLKKEAALKQQYLEQSLSSIDDLIKRLRYGDLSFATPQDRLAGVGGTYAAALAQVSANPYDQAALQNYSGAGADYAAELRSFYGSTVEGARKISELLQTAQTIESNVRSGSATSTGGTVDPNVAALVAQVQSLTAELTAERESRVESDDAVNNLALLVKRLLSKAA